MFSQNADRKPASDGEPSAKAGMQLFFDLLRQNAWELLLLNLMFLLASLPVITLPPALAAMSRINMQAFEQRGCPLLRSFWTAFRETFGASYAIGLPIAVVDMAAFFLVPFYLAAAAQNAMFFLPLAVVVTTVLLATMAGFYAFAMLGTVDLPLGKLLKNAILLAFLRFPVNVAACVALAFIAIVILIGLPYTAAALSIAFALGNFIATFCAWGGIRRYIVADDPR